MLSSRQEMLRPEWVEVFLKHCHRKQYDSKTIIIQHGQKPETLYYILSGSVSVFIEGSDGHEMVLAYLNWGEFFGELGLFDVNSQRSAWVTARSSVVLGEISYSKFKLLIQECPNILFALSQQMASRLRNTSSKVRDLAFVDVSGRIAATLLDLVKQPDAVTHPDGMQIRITRQELARIVGCSREMAGRVLRELEDRGLISSSGKTTVVFGAR